MPDEVPDIEVRPEPANDGQDTEARLLALGAQVQGLLAKERSQRIWLKWIASVVGLVVIIGMSFLLGHSIHNIFWGPFMRVSSTVAVAIYVVPVVSITTITVALFVASFRRFEEKDLETAGASIAGGIGIARGG